MDGTGRPELDRLRRVAGDVAWQRVALLVVGWAAVWLQTTDAVRPDFDLDHWNQWDAHHLLRLAEVGYDDSVADGNSAAFFPGFPLVVAVVRRLIGTGYLTAGLVVSALATVAAAYHLHRLAEHDGHSGDRAVTALLWFPTAVFLVAPYTEALFLAAAVPAFLYARQGKPWHAAPCVFLACLVRSVGVFVAVGVVIELLRRPGAGWGGRRLWRPAAVGLIGALPVLGYGLYLERAKGSFLEFLDAQERGWGRRFTNPIDGFLATADTWWGGGSANHAVALQLELAFAALIAALVVWLLVRREWGYAAFAAGTLAVSVTSPLWLSIPRFALTLFPFTFVVADLTADPTWERRAMPVLAATSLVGVAAYVRGFWFF